MNLKGVAILTELYIVIPPLNTPGWKHDSRVIQDIFCSFLWNENATILSQKFDQKPGNGRVRAGDLGGGAFIGGGCLFGGIMLTTCAFI